MINRKYDVYGEYFEYLNYIVIKQDHPNLVKYAIYKEDNEQELQFVDTCSTIKLSKEFIKELNKI